MKCDGYFSVCKISLTDIVNNFKNVFLYFFIKFHYVKKIYRYSSYYYYGYNYARFYLQNLRLFFLKIKFYVYILFSHKHHKNFLSYCFY